MQAFTLLYLNFYTAFAALLTAQRSLPSRLLHTYMENDDTCMDVDSSIQIQYGFYLWNVGKEIIMLSIMIIIKNANTKSVQQ